MAFNGDFSVSQGLDVQAFTINDTSTGSDPNLTGRTISLFLQDNQLLGGSVVPWPLSDGSSKLLSGLLLRDYSLSIVVAWQSSSPIPGSTYSKTHIWTSTGNSNQFAYGLLQQIAANKALTKAGDFMYNLFLVNSDINNANRANSFLDQGSAQDALDRIYYKIVNQNYFF